MRCKDLAKELLKTPRAEILISVDVSTCEDDAEKRAFASEIEGVQINTYNSSDMFANKKEDADHISIICIGELN